VLVLKTALWAVACASLFQNPVFPFFHCIDCQETRMSPPEAHGGGMNQYGDRAELAQTYTAIEERSSEFKIAINAAAHLNLSSHFGSFRINLFSQ
jgi:hypothetical protein